VEARGQKIDERGDMEAGIRDLGSRIEDRGSRIEQL
jgi:hypothetical protein